MKASIRSIMGLAAALLLCAGLAALGCSSGNAGSPGGASASAAASADSPSREIAVYSREDGSGTRSAFVELFGLQQKDASGNAVDITTPQAAITNSTAVMMTSVAGDPDSIGYISLGSLNDSVKAVSIDGAAAEVGNIKNGTYRISRPFNIVTGQDVSDQAKDFIAFIMSSDGQAVVEDNHYIAVADNAPAYEPSGQSGRVVVAGSSSVTPVMEKLAEAYRALNPDVAVEVQQSDSSTGVQMAVEGTCDIGMASRDLKDSEAAAGVQAAAIANDGIAVIVSPDSPVDALTSDQVLRIFSGDALAWDEVLG